MILSVVIPTMNKQRLLERTLGALRQQDLGDQAWDIVVVNDGSTDGTAALLETLAADEPRLKVVSPPRNVGRARARNLGWRHATGRWVLFLDDDILAPQGLLKAHLDVLRTGDDVGTIGHAVTAPDIADAPHFYYLDTRAVAKLPAGPAPARYLVTQNAAVPRWALERIDGFDESFSAYGFEDMDLGFRLEDAGVTFRALPAPLPLHIHHHTLADYLAKKRECGRCSLRQLAERHPKRLREMRLHVLVDPPGVVAAAPVRAIRSLLARILGPAAITLASRWPARGSAPVLPVCYLRCMDICVLASFCQGLRSSLPDSDTMAQ